MERNANPAPARASSTVYFWIRARACLLAAAMLAGGASAQQSPKQRSKSNQPPLTDNPLEVQTSRSLRSETRLVHLSVIVDDRHGKPITGLTRHDFTVMDNGKKEPIQVFLVRESEPRGNRPAELPPDTYSNRMADRKTPMSATAILLDGLNTQISDQQYARLQVIKFLNQIQPQDRVALYTLGDQLKLLHDFTNDAQSLLQALHDYQGHISRDMQRTQTRPQTPDTDAQRTNAARLPTQSSSRSAQDDMLAGVFDQLDEAERGLQARDRAVRTVQALKAIANHMALLPGRKNLVWVAGSFLPAASLQDVEMNTPNGGLLFTADLDSVARNLNNASLVVYPVDARGLLVGAGFAGYGLPNYGEFAVMDQIAQRTGGKAFYNTNDIFGAIRKAVDDSRVSYEIGYYPEIEDWNGSFHKVRIKVDRHGAHVRARQGYFAVPSPAVAPKDQRAFFNAAATNMLEADGIGITVHVSPPAAEGAAQRNLSMSVTLEPGSLNLEQASQMWTGSFDTMLVQLDAKGVVLAASDDPVQLHITTDQYRQIVQYGLSYREKTDIRPSAAQLRVVVRDLESGKTGSAAVPLGHYFPISKPAS